MEQGVLGCYLDSYQFSHSEVRQIHTFPNHSLFPFNRESHVLEKGESGLANIGIEVRLVVLKCDMLQVLIQSSGDALALVVLVDVHEIDVISVRQRGKTHNLPRNLSHNHHLLRHDIQPTLGILNAGSSSCNLISQEIESLLNFSDILCRTLLDAFLLSSNLLEG